MRPTVGGEDEFSVATFDSARKAFLPMRAAFPGCGAGYFMTAMGQRFSVHCGHTNSIKVATIGPDGAIDVVKDISLPLHPVGSVPWFLSRVSAVTDSKDGATMAVVMADGEVKTGNSPDFTFRSRISGLPDRYIPMRAWPSSPDGRILYVASGRISERSEGVGDTIEVIDLEHEKRLPSISPGIPIWSMAISKDGHLLFAFDPKDQRIAVINTVTKTVERVMTGLGAGPALGISVP